MKTSQRASRLLPLALIIASSSTAAHAIAADDPLPSPPDAATDAATDVAQLNEQGLELYAARDYRRAAEKFIQAHAIARDPNLLFNIARCYEELGETDAALEKYELFLAAPEADPAGTERARQSIRALRQREEDRARAEASAEEPKKTSAPALIAEPEEQIDWVPWLTLGGTVAFTALGATFYALGVSDHDRVTDLPEYGTGNAVADMTWREANDWVSSGDTKKLIGGLSFGAAGALAATYVTLWLTDRAGGEKKVEPALEVDATAHEGGGRLELRGSF